MNMQKYQLLEPYLQTEAASILKEMKMSLMQINETHTTSSDCNVNSSEPEANT